MALSCLIVLKIFVASVVLYYLADATKSSKQQVEEIFNQGANAIAQIDDIQRSYECCGILGYFDWASDALPSSCCPNKISAEKCLPPQAFKTGCSETVGASVEGIGTTICLVLFGIAFFEIAGLVLSLCLHNTWKNEKRRSEQLENYPPRMPTAPSDDYS